MPAKYSRLVASCLLVVTFVTPLPGCGRKRSSEPVFAADVRGSVFLDEEPLGWGTVTFIPDVPESSGGRPGIARIGPDGTYWIGNANLDKPAGLRPGRYKVTVLAMTPDPAGTGLPVAELAIPESYADPATTPFEVHVLAGANHFDLRLKR
jgi:hypothetical protein